MAKRKLKGFVIPTIYAICFIMIVSSLFVIAKDFKQKEVPEENTDYVINSILNSVEPVISEEVNFFMKPYTSENVEITKTYYSKDDTEEEQQKSLLYYENTYLQNNGIVYGSSEDFDVIASNKGTVLEVKQDEILNTVVYIKHDDNITTIYYGLKDVTVKENDQVEQGMTIGKSTNNKFCDKASSILFEVNKDGKLINPEDIFNSQN